MLDDVLIYITSVSMSFKNILTPVSMSF